MLEIIQHSLRLLRELQGWGHGVDTVEKDELAKGSFCKGGPGLLFRYPRLGGRGGGCLARRAKKRIFTMIYTYF